MKSKIVDARRRFRIWENPTAYTRADRRSVGIRGKVSPFRAELDTFVPRYVRRHWSKVEGATRPFTRRVRKQRARMGRALIAAGMTK